MPTPLDIAFGSERQHRSMHFIINDTPVALARCRMTGNGKVFDSQKQQKMIIGLSLAAQLGSKPLFTGPLEVDLKFFFPISKSKSPKHRLEQRGKPHIFKPDIDNCIKMYLDCASGGVLFKDDAIIATIHSQKIYDDIARVEILITELL